ncbi:FAD/FMN-binding family oxidoreductase (macronuclear) [Tetrahymena thermophila SB210]|uniref:FAD/FMN-binding family oxidoreductase n=1 Tax=Tetrahymena thermophila (strain SB210) TaxID=312017 RepID=I7MDG6_TETTS|nr:FAD/FMN-binding family oxidoreductase [Tetrahymena thermophila SB210]EAR87547.1 FAD/FMN-binding family oxidoreductase [Tetrahymena thermophila SB210]|eukprot:XP_001007792.1 FAD/FMN-binding family oxidoreductase [Tetrahymena thermophila SB210]
MNTPITLGALTLKNRFIVAPLTRIRADPKDGVANDLVAEYYGQRTSYGLIITECSQIDIQSNGFPGSCGIYSKEQVQGWKKVVENVHSKGGLIMLQIWHCGRAAKLQNTGGKKIVSSTDVPLSDPGSDTPHRLTVPEIKEIVEQFRQGAINAKEAGFDGIQLHGANGYLVDQFLRNGVNDRTDEYGGSIENRSRFALEVLDALISVFGPERTAIRISPTGNFQDMYDSNPLELYQYLLKEFEKRKLAFVEIRRHAQRIANFIPKGLNVTLDQQIPDLFNTLRKYYSGNIVGNDSITIEEAEKLTINKTVQAVSFGKLSISNPDLPIRYQNNWPINYNYDVETFYKGGEKGYIDYETYKPVN